MDEDARIGEILVKGMLITAEKLQEALEKQKKVRKPLGQTLIDLNHITEEDLNRALKQQEDLQLVGPADKKDKDFFQGESSWFRRKRIPIGKKTSVLITLIIVGMVLPISFLILKKQNEQAVERMMAFGTALVNNYANYSAEFVLLEDWPSLDPFIREVGKLEEVSYVFIIDGENVIKAHSDSDMMDQVHRTPEDYRTLVDEEIFKVIRYRDPEGGRILDFSQNIVYQDRKIGTLHLGVSEMQMEKDARSLQYFIIILTILAIIVGLAVSYGVGTLLSRSISALVSGTREIGMGNFTYRITPRMNDELGDLALAFNEMADGLRKKELIQDSFGRYVTPEIVEMILKNPEEVWLKGSRKMVTILFADIRGFTEFSEDREPEEVVGVLNQFFTMATEVILHHGGNVDKFVGDQVMGVFGAPIYYDDHALKAVSTAVKLVESLNEWNLSREKEGKPAIMAGIGINTGLVVAGNLGSEQRMEYTVIGDDVNLAARLTSMAAPGEIIVSEKTAEHLKNEAELESLEAIKVKGMKHPVMIYRVVSIKKDPSENGV
jgi:adenylate cyclase